MSLFFETTPDDDQLISKIADRIIASPDSPYADKMGAIIEISLTHALICPLNLQGLLGARDADFWHDIFGIASHLDRSTAKFNPPFEPRYALRRHHTKH